jgi:hypothetical protein
MAPRTATGWLIRCCRRLGAAPWAPIGGGCQGEPILGSLGLRDTLERGCSDDGGPTGLAPLASPSIGEPLAPEGKERMVWRCFKPSWGAAIVVRGGALLCPRKGEGRGGIAVDCRGYKGSEARGGDWGQQALARMAPCSAGQAPASCDRGRWRRDWQVGLGVFKI